MLFRSSIYRTPEQFSVLNRRLDELLDKVDRPRDAVVRSQMKGLIFGEDQTDLESQLNGKTTSDFLESGLLAGTPNQIVDQLGQLREVGVQKVMLQWSDYENISKLENFSNSILPQL